VVDPPAAPEISREQVETEGQTETTATPDHGPVAETLAAETAPIGAAGGTLGASTVSASPRLTTAAQTSDPAGPTEVTATEARYLRTYETFPSLPRSLWGSGRVYDVLAQVCVSTDGGVSGVSIRDGAAPELDRLISATVASWRYRPRLVAGAPRPFCHLMKFVYTTR
jgi:outer membrane biosynthesis protein TonB